MNHSIYSADRATHLKIVIVALVSAVAVSGLAISSHVRSDNAGFNTAAVKVGKPIAMTAASMTVSR